MNAWGQRSLNFMPKVAKDTTTTPRQFGWIRKCNVKIQRVFWW